MNIVKGDIFKLVQSGDMIIHGTNCCGKMGAGIAATVAIKFPYVFDMYLQQHEDFGLEPGTIQCIRENGIVIVNAMTQVYPGAHAKLQYLEQCMNAVVNWCANQDFTGDIYLPLIGCGIGGLNIEDCIPLYEILDITGLKVNLVIYE